MIEPVSSDIGRSVIYKHSHHNGKMEVYSVIEQGVITSFNESYVFVRYDGHQHTQATRREDLQWVNGENKL